MQQWCYKRQEIARYLLIALRGSVDTVGLHTARRPIDVLKQKGEQGHVVLLSQQRVSPVELADVIRSIVGRQCDAAEHNFDSCMLQGGDDLVEVFAGAVDGQAAEAVVAAEGDDDKNRLQGQYILQPFNAVLCSVAADARVHYAVGEAFGVEITFEKIGITVAGIGTVTCSKAVAKSHDDRAVVMRLNRRLRRCSGLWGGLRRRSWLFLAADDADYQGKGNPEPQSGTARVHHTFNLAAESRRDEGTRRKGAA
jgi:hypothetical protein